MATDFNCVPAPGANTDCVAGVISSFTLSDIGLMMGIRIKAYSDAADLFTDEELNDLFVFTWYDIGGNRAIQFTPSGAVHGYRSWTGQYALLADGTGNSNPVDVLVTIHYNPPEDPGNIDGAIVGEDINAPEIIRSPTDSTDASIPFWKFVYAAGITAKKQSDSSTIASGSWFTTGATNIVNFAKFVASEPGVYIIRVYVAVDNAGLGASTARTFTVAVAMAMGTSPDLLRNRSRSRGR